LTLFRVLNPVDITAILGKFAKFWKATTSSVISVCPSLCPRATTQLLLDGFSLSLLTYLLHGAESFLRS